MKCDDYQKLLHLNRPGELDEPQAKIIEEHLKVCPTCLKKQQEIIKADITIAQLREMKLVLPETVKLTNKIMSQIEASVQKEEKGFNKLINPVLDFLTLFQVRFALSLITISLLATLLVQQIFILHHVTGLENRMASGQAVSNKYYTIKTSELASIFNPSELRSLVIVLFRKDMKSSDDLIFLKKSIVESWAEKLGTKEKKNLDQVIWQKFFKSGRKIIA